MGKGKRHEKWKKESLKLKPNHGWKAKPGYNVMVLDRGAVRFDIPRDWHVEPDSESIKLRDKPPPDDDCLLQVSMMKLHGGIDWSQISLVYLLEGATKDDERGTVRVSETIYTKRPDLVEIAWYESSFIDPNEKREARSRACLARGRSVQGYVVQPFITMDFWLDDYERFVPVWEEVLRSLTLGEYIQDPTRRVLH